MECVHFAAFLRGNRKWVNLPPLWPPQVQHRTRNTTRHQRECRHRQHSRGCCNNIYEKQLLFREGTAYPAIRFRIRSLQALPGLEPWQLQHTIVHLAFYIAWIVALLQGQYPARLTWNNKIYKIIHQTVLCFLPLNKNKPKEQNKTTCTVPCWSA